MEEKKVIKISWSTFFLILAIFIIVIMGIFIYKLNNDKTTEISRASELQSQVNTLNETVSKLQEKTQELSYTIDKETSTNVTTETTEINELYIIKKINISSENSLYNFKTKEWVQQINGAEGMYYIAIDNEKNLYIVDRFENILKKLDAKLEKLNIDDTNVDNCITYANVSQKDNTLVISTEDTFITYIVNLEDLSTKLAEINDN